MIKILIATHKEWIFPDNEIFLPIQVGAEIAEKKMGIQGDNEGEHISRLNPNFCELTALYWAWKNLKPDIIGLYHYRRYFNFDKVFLYNKDMYKFPKEYIKAYKFPETKVKGLLKKYDIILSQPRVYPLSLETDYMRGHISEDLKIVENIIKEMYPEYVKSWDRVMKKNNKLSHYNMFICKYVLFDKYCQWLFDVLFEAKIHIKLSPYEAQQRVFGYLSERMLMVFCEKNKLKVDYRPINWYKDDNESMKNISCTRLRNIKNNLSFYVGNPRAILKSLS